MLTPTLTTIGDSQNQIIAEMIRNQLSDVAADKRLLHTDFRRIVRYIGTSIFTPGVCSLWQGYVTDRKTKNKGSYVNFYFRQKKVALHRLLYLNFLGPLADDEYVKFTCDNKGHCCSVHCLQKHKYRRIPPHNMGCLTASISSHDGDYTVINSNTTVLVPEERLNVFFI